ncbi:LuxR family transcriptional regulator [Streptomyces sp. DSM 118878]
MTDRRDDELERSLLDIQSLIETIVALHRSRGSQEQLITTLDEDYDGVLARARRLVEGAAHTIDIVHAHERGPGEQAPRPERELIHGAREGVEVRLLTRAGPVDEGFVREQLDRERPVAVRVTRIPQLQVMIVDGRIALVVAYSAGGHRASLIRVPEVLHTLAALFDHAWAHAVPAGERVVFESRSRAVLAARILRALHGGVTDEVAARGLGMSVRTYRRHVADIMALLGAGSRFQAGVRAAELGLLPPAAGPELPYESSLAAS